MTDLAAVGEHGAVAAGAAASAIDRCRCSPCTSIQARRGIGIAPCWGCRWPVRYALYGAVFYLVLLFGDFEGAQFIYFQF